MWSSGRRWKAVQGPPSECALRSAGQALHGLLASKGGQPQKQKADSSSPQTARPAPRNARRTAVGLRLRLGGVVGGDGVAGVQQLHADAVSHLGLGLDAHDFGDEFQVERTECRDDVHTHAHAIAVQAGDEIEASAAVIPHDLNFLDQLAVRVRGLYPDLPRGFMAPIQAAFGTGGGRISAGRFALGFGTGLFCENLHIQLRHRRLLWRAALLCYSLWATELLGSAGLPAGAE